MHVHFGSDLLQPEWNDSVVCVGTFDGVHLGHQEVIGQAREIAASHDLPLILVTFDRHPAKILAPDRVPKTISSLAGNLKFFDQLGVSLALILPFTKELGQTTAQEFFAEVLQAKLHASQVVVGYDFAFGHGREGTPAWLSARIATTVVEPFCLDGTRVSSSGVRALISSGDFPAVQRLLGRNWAMPGLVYRGKQIGRTLGFPTLNLARSFDQVLPPIGVYDGVAETRFGSFRAAISIGNRPAIGGGPLTIEAFLLDYPGESLYGTSVLLRFQERIRDERDFPDLESLALQIQRDVDWIRANNGSKI